MYRYMYRAVCRSLVALVLVLTSLILGGTAVARDSNPAIAPGMNPRTDGETVVWQAENTGQQFDIYAMVAGATTGKIIAGGATDQFTPDVDGDRVVWVEGDPLTNAFDVKGINLSTMTPFTVSATDAIEITPAISGNWVVWVSSGPDPSTGLWTSSLLARDLSTSDAPITLDVAPYGTSTGSAGIFRPAIDGDRVVWIDAVQETTHSVHWTLMTRRLSDASATQITEGYYDNAGPGAYLGPLKRPGYDLQGNVLVYSTNLNLFMLNLESGVTTHLAIVPESDWLPAQNPTIDGRYVFWQDYRYTNDSLGLSNIARGGLIRTDLMGYDLQTGSEFPVTTNTGTNTNPLARGGELVYTRTNTANPTSSEVHAVPVSQELPTAAEPDPGTTNPNWIYFPLTGHYLANGFKDFWTASGGLPVFGYPLTGEYSEAGLAVQFTERQRFEYHPEFAGTPYESELGRLGYESAESQGLLSSAPFQALPATTASDANCTFYAATGHRLCAGFKAYWQAHGLDFGDAGISARESLALFGYPISEEFVDPSSGLVMQYFERARFEYHPENAEPYKVLLTRLGADVISSHGW
jgi:hypothetical protein